MDQRYKTLTFRRIKGHPQQLLLLLVMFGVR